MYGASEGLRTIVVEREAPGGQAGTSSRIENYLGFPSGVSGDELASRALQQARRLGAEILVTRAITRIDAATRQVHLDGGDVLRARTIILACGVTWRRLSIEGFDRLAGKGISYGAARSEAASTHGLDVHIVGAGNSAGQAAMFFSTHARSVTILCRGDGLEKSMSRYLIDQLAARSNIRVLHRTEVVAAHGEVSLEAIDVRNAATGRDDAAASRAGCSSSSARMPRPAWLPPEIALDRRGYVLTGSDVTRRRTLGARPRPVPARDERPGHLRVRRRAVRPGEARRRRRRRGQHGDRLRAPVPQGGECSAEPRRKPERVRAAGARGEVERIDERRRVADLPVVKPAVQLRLERLRTLGRLLPVGRERPELSPCLDELEHPVGTERTEQLALEVGIAGEEAVGPNPARSKPRKTARSSATS